MQEELTVGKAAELADLTPGQVSSILFSGIVVPEIHDPNGSGDHSVLSPKNVRELKLVGNLKKIGLKAVVVKSILDLLATSRMDWWKGGDSYVVVLKNSRWFITDNAFSDVNKSLFKEDGIILLVKI